MTIVTIGGQKGGIGKTTIAFNLAYLRQKKIGNILLIDADDQASSSKWAALRSKDPSLPEILVIQKFGDKDFINAVKNLNNHYKEIIIDVGGRNTFELRAAMVVANVFVMPLKTSQLDVLTIGTIDQMLGEAKGFNPKLKAMIAPNSVSTNPVINELEELLELTPELQNISITKAVIRERISFRKAVKQGKTIFELDTLDRKAIDEFSNLYKEIYND